MVSVSLGVRGRTKNPKEKASVENLTQFLDKFHSKSQPYRETLISLYYFNCSSTSSLRKARYHRIPKKHGGVPFHVSRARAR